jgi:hypothetical protein
MSWQLEPHQAGGGRAVLVSAGAYLPPAAWEWLSVVDEHLVGCDRGAADERAHRGQARCPRLAASSGAAVALSDGAAAALSAAGGEIAAAAEACTLRDVRMLFGPDHAVELDVS